MLVMSDDELAVFEGVVLDASVEGFELDELGGVELVLPCEVEVDELGVELGELESVACGVLLP